MNMDNPGHPFPQAKVARVLLGSARSGRKRFSGKPSSPEAPVFSRKTMHSRDTHLWKPVGMNHPDSQKQINMERMNLNEAEVTVTTQHLIDMSSDSSYNMSLSDFSDMGEFLCSCSERFPDERAPAYRYVWWDNIPEGMINREWLCPNFFDVREALAQLNDEDVEYFRKWCDRYRYDLRTDNPYQLVAHYMNLFGESNNTADYLPEAEDDSCSYTYIPDGWIDSGLLRQEIFGDDYD